MRVVAIVAVVLTSSVAAAAQLPAVDTVLERMRAFIDRFDTRMASVVAEEQYRQHIELRPPPARKRAPRPGDPIVVTRIPTVESRVLRSEYALLQASNGSWVGFRDTFEVDGTPVHDRQDRLQGLLASGAVAEASRIAQESARLNIGSEFVFRNVNNPALALKLLDRTNRPRFSFRRALDDTIDGVPVWRIDFDEQRRPTLVKGIDGRDQRSHGTVWVDPATGDLWRTMLWWEAMSKRITVNYGRVSTMDVLVPVAMSERYDVGEVLVTGEATYTNYRQFQTGARIVVP